MFKLKFCGYFIDANGVCPLKEKVNVLQQFPLPITKQKLRKFLGLIYFYRRFIPGCARLLQPLNDLLPARKKYCNGVNRPPMLSKPVRMLQPMLLSSPIPGLELPLVLSTMLPTQKDNNKLTNIGNQSFTSRRNFNQQRKSTVPLTVNYYLSTQP